MCILGVGRFTINYKECLEKPGRHTSGIHKFHDTPSDVLGGREKSRNIMRNASSRSLLDPLRRRDTS